LRADDFGWGTESNDLVRTPVFPRVGYALQMQVRVLYFGVLKELLKRDGERLELPAKASVGTLLEAIVGDRPGGGEMWKLLAVAVNREYVDADWTLHEGDEVALLPPVSGGADED